MQVVAATVVAATVVAVGAVITPVTATAEEDAGTAGIGHRHVRWQACDLAPPPYYTQEQWDALFTGIDCGKITVPVDYRSPRSGTMEITVTRRKASKPAERRGVLLLNPGGPGQEGVTMPKAFEDQGIADVYDLIGFSPRGVVYSGELSCDTPTTVTEDSRPPDELFAAITEDARRLERGCAAAGGEVRKHISTANTARDMDLLRAALGERKINYLGFSYGTYLGAVYGSLFPHRLDRSVLDSSMHPGWLYYEATKQQAVGATRNVEALAAWAAERDGTFGLGKTPEEVLRRFDALRGRLQANPVHLPDDPPGIEPIDGTVFDIVIGTSATYRPLWTETAELVRLLDSLADGAPVTPEAAEALALLVDHSETVLRPGSYQAVTCEADWPTDLNAYYEQMRIFREKYPYTAGAMAAAPSNCTFRSFTPPEKLVDLKRRGYPRGLVVQAEADPITPYEGGVVMAGELDDRLVTVTDEGGHGLYGRNACVTELVDAYLVRGTVPARGTTCAGQPRPDVPADGDATAAAPRTPVAEPLADRIRSVLDAYGPLRH
ncbi:alpha/beta hydrolase [Saccharothrix yanglingensis]|uniref:Alpha/beta hydrolase n=2 Tax=Saccharothrix yanglingensis TaxID=659496 RepID=A0ABU0X773_9PSEU|nr:alpha/beta hydrolase [Saccharothrix yanglingensis]